MSAGFPIEVRHASRELLADDGDVGSLGAVGEVGVSRQRVLDAVVAEFEASCAERLDMRCHHVRVPGGIVEFCGTEADPNCWNAAYVTDARAVLPLVVGHRDRVAHAYQRLDRANTPFWDAALFPPPIVRVDGNLFYFAPARGRLLLGQVRLERRAVLLAAIGDEQIAVIHVEGRARSVLHVGSPHSFRELDVDLQLRLQRRTGRGSAPSDPVDPVRPTAAILAHHRRIVHGITVDMGPGPSIPEILTACFEDLADRARALRANGKPVRGKRWIRHVTRFLCKLAIRGVGDLVGRIGEIIAAIQEHHPAFTITPEAMSDVLGRLQLLGTCIVGPRDDGDRIWQINLAGLGDPSSTIHRRLCRETRTRRATAVPVETARGEGLTTSDSGPPRAAEAVAASGDQPPTAATPPASPVDATVGLDTLSPPEPATAATIAAPPDANNPATATLPPDSASTSHTPPSAAADAPVDDRVRTPKADSRADDLAAAVRELLELPPAAGRTLRLGVRVHREWRAAARRAGDPGVGDGPPSPRSDQPDPARVLGKPPQSARRRLHVSPDHMFGLPRLAIVAHAVRSSPGESQPRPKNSSRRPGPVRREPRRARGPPDDTL